MTSGRASRRLPLAIGSVAIVLAFTAWFVLSRETFETVAEDCFDSIASGGGGSISHRFPDREQKMYGLSTDQWASLLTNYVRPAMKGWVHGGEPRVEWGPQRESAAFVHGFAYPDGRRALLRIEVIRTPDGLKVPSLTRNLISCVASMKYGTADGATPKLRLIKASAELYSRDAAELQKFGLHGLYMLAPEGILTWADLANQMQKMAAGYEERLKNRSPSGPAK